MKKRMNKKAWIRIVEAFLAVIIVLSAIIIILARQPVQSDIGNIVYERQTQILEIVRNDDVLRGDILEGRDERVSGIISSMMPSSWNFTTRICEIDDICSGDVPVGENIYAKEIIISSNLTSYNLKKLRLFVWVGRKPVFSYCNPDCFGKECGSDGCGGSCGACRTGETCDNGICISNCTGKTCIELGKECGTWDNGCGTNIDCGNCDGGKVCSNGICVSSGGCGNGVCDPGETCENCADCCSYDIAYKITLDNNGNVFVAGTSSSATSSMSRIIKYNALNGDQINIVSETDVSVGGICSDVNNNIYFASSTDIFDYYIKKYDNNFNPIWDVMDTDGHSPFAITADDSGNTYVTGLKYSSNVDIYTLKYDNAGNKTWSKSFNTGFRDQSYDITLDSSGNIYITGYFEENGNNDFLTIKYDNNGNYLWNISYDKGGNEAATHVKVDHSNNIYIAGVAPSSVIFLKYDINKNLIWEKILDSKGINANKIFIDSNFNVYIVGSIASGSDFVMSIIKYNWDGGFAWMKNHKCNNNRENSANDVIVDVNGNIYVTGSTNAGISSLDYNFCTIKYNPSGTLIWEKVEFT